MKKKTDLVSPLKRFFLLASNGNLDKTAPKNVIWLTKLPYEGVVYIYILIENPQGEFNNCVGVRGVDQCSASLPIEQEE